MKNITFDLETLGNTSKAPIVQIAAVEFTDTGDIIREFNRYIDVLSLEKYMDNFHIDTRTIHWWLTQEDKAIKSVFRSDGTVDLKNALVDFAKWLKEGDITEYVFWSHATFDPPILHNNYIAVGSRDPIRYVAHRDIRTLTHFAGDINVTRIGIHHNALDDCKYQAKYISQGINQINNLK